MKYEELKIINYGNPSIEFLNKALTECKGIMDFYRAQLAIDKKPYWKGKLGYQGRQKKEIERQIKEYINI